MQIVHVLNERKPLERTEFKRNALKRCVKISDKKDVAILGFRKYRIGKRFVFHIVVFLSL